MMNAQQKSIDKRLMDLQGFEVLVHSIKDYAIYMLDVHGYVVSWNPGAERFKGFRASDILGRHFSIFHTAEDQVHGIPQAALHEAEMNGTYSTQGWRVRKGGTQFWADVVIDPIRSADGRLMGFAKITRDISKQKAAEDALHQSEQLFRLLVQGVTDYAIYMLDPKGHVASWNMGAERIKGYSANEVVGSHFGMFYTPEDQGAALPEKVLAQALQDGRYEQEGWRVRKGGDKFYAHVIVDPIFNDESQLIGYAKITRDITERRLADLRLKQTETALRQSQRMEAVGKLTGSIAHDFNNLLQVIAGNLQLLSRDVPDSPQGRRHIRGALDGVGRGATLTKQLLAFARRQPLEPKVINLGRLLRTLEDMLQRAVGDAVEFEAILAAGLWNTVADIAHVESCLLNLAINARDAMDGHGKLTVEVANVHLDEICSRGHAEVRAGPYVMLAVSDTGKGMSPEVAAQAFDPFFSTKPAGQATGLGLSMVYGFVKQSGGHIKIYSEVGHGTSVKLYLPRSQRPEDKIVPSTEMRVIGGSETVLVVEDDDGVRATVVETLSDLGYNVLKAIDADAALVIIKSGAKIDALFTDVVMPGALRSPELARIAREYLPKIAVLFTSGYTQNGIIHGGRLDSGTVLLSKPYTREELARKIRMVLGGG